MTMRSRAALQALLLLLATFANAVLKNVMHIRILDSQTQAVSRGENGVPRNCDQVNFDAYCRSSTYTPMISTLLVQEGDGPPFRITCTIESRYSKCVPLPIGETFDARREKHGIAVYYTDDKGRLRQQLYTYEAGEPAAAAVATTTSPTVSTSSASATTPVPPTAAAANPAPVTASAPAAAQPVAAAPSASATQGTVKCNFSSTPAGAEITLDGQYIGSTPSVLKVSVGAHAVVISLPGFAPWKRDLTVTAGSELTVNAVLEKQ